MNSDQMARLEAIERDGPPMNGIVPAGVFLWSDFQSLLAAARERDEEHRQLVGAQAREADWRKLAYEQEKLREQADVARAHWDAERARLTEERDEALNQIGVQTTTVVELNRGLLSLRDERARLLAAIKWVESYYWRVIAPEGCPCDDDKKCPLHAALAGSPEGTITASTETVAGSSTAGCGTLATYAEYYGGTKGETHTIDLAPEGTPETPQPETLELPKWHHWTDKELFVVLPKMTLAQRVEVLIGKFIGGGIESYYDGKNDSLTAGRSIARYMMGRFKKFGVSFNDPQPVAEARAEAQTTCCFQKHATLELYCRKAPNHTGKHHDAGVEWTADEGRP